MASVVNNLRINNEEPKVLQFNGVPVKELYFNGELIWKNSNPFLFVPKITGELPQLDEDTLLFVGFGEEEFKGSYNIVEDITTETNVEKGQMVVVETTEGEKQ